MVRFPLNLSRTLFVPILAGASLADRLRAGLGALIAIGLTSFICTALPLPLPFASHELPLIVAPIGASAVLLFAVPASPLAQPWPIIGGNTISALVGICVVQLVHDPLIASGIAVGGAIIAMSLTRSLHPPGGATALSTVLGGPAVLAADFAYPFVPVMLNSLVLVGLGLLFHRFSSHSYPHRPVVIPDEDEEDGASIEMVDIDMALEELGETLDVDRADLETLLHRAEIHARHRMGVGRAGVGTLRIIAPANRPSEAA